MNLGEKLNKTRLLVILSESREKLIIPLKWLHHESTDMSWIVDFGIKESRDRKLFFSTNANDKADFSLPIRIQFCPQVAACYIGKVLRSCGNASISI